MRDTSKLIVRFVLPAMLVAVMALIMGKASAVNPAAHSPVSPQLIGTIDDLVSHIEGLNLNRGQRDSLISKLQSVKSAAERANPCTSLNILDAYFNEVEAWRQRGDAALAEDLFNRGWELRDDFFDGFVEPTDRCFDSSIGRKPQVEIKASDNTRFSASISFGAPKMWTVEDGGETWTQLELPAIQAQIGAPGTPAIPSWQALVAVPHGATPMIANLGPQRISHIFHLNLYPYQKEAVDQDEEPPPPPETFADKPFVKSEQAYATDSFYPPTPCAVRMLGSMRDLDVAQVECTAGQYNPVTDELRLFDSVQFDVQFGGGDGNFATTLSVSPFEPASKTAMGSVLNSGILDQYLKVIDPSLLPCYGEELLILTHPNFRSAADDLAIWKRDKGIATTVINVGSGTTYDTAAKIDDLIEHRYDECSVRPSYVLLMGDSEWVPPSSTTFNNTSEPDATTGSDWGYATYPHLELLFLDSLFPYFSVGRISVDTADEAQTVVDKIVGYESSPPFINLGSGGPFYTTASVVSQFQCCRTNTTENNRDQRSFVETSETLRDTLSDAGKSVERIYTETGPSITPNRYWDGDLLPADLRAGSGFGWNGNTQDIIDAFNGGRFLITHRDHGGPSQWVNPPFSTSNLGSVTNGARLPVIYSVNCKSAYWDRETDGFGTTESLMEQLLLKANGGMVGGIGDVRNSPTWPNSALLRGFVDATWPNLAPEFGSSTSLHRLGDIMDHGKIYLATQVGAAQPAGDVVLQDYLDEIVLYHTLGDPTLEMWTHNPYGLVLPLAYTAFIEHDNLYVQYAIEGATITAFQQTDKGLLPLGRGMVKGGMAQLPFFLNGDPNRPVILSASLENAVSVLLTPPSEVQPDLVIQQLDLGESNVVIRGEDLAGRLTITVANIGDGNAPGTVNADGSAKPADTGYAIDLVLSEDTVVPPGFASLPAPEGEAYVEDGLLQGGRVSRTQDVTAGGEVVMPVGPPVNNDVGGIIPLQAPTGKMFLCARIDPPDHVAESDEDNNVTCQEVTVQAPIG